MNPKIAEHHRSRPAYVYLRQSTPYQVRHHQESTERQYIEIIQELSYLANMPVQRESGAEERALPSDLPSMQGRPPSSGGCW